MIISYRKTHRTSVSVFPEIYSLRPLYIHAILRDIATRPPVKGTGGVFVRKKNLMLQTTIVIDYQNMHNVAFKTWGEYLGYANPDTALGVPFIIRRNGNDIYDSRLFDSW